MEKGECSNTKALPEEAGIIWPDDDIFIKVATEGEFEFQTHSEPGSATELGLVPAAENWPAEWYHGMPYVVPHAAFYLNGVLYHGPYPYPPYRFPSIYPVVAPPPAINAVTATSTVTATNLSGRGDHVRGARPSFQAVDRASGGEADRLRGVCAECRRAGRILFRCPRECFRLCTYCNLRGHTRGACPHRRF